MQKLSETVYSSLFWLISGLLVWLVIVPVTLVCFPIVVLVKAAGQLLLQMSQSNLIEVERRSHKHPDSQPTHTTAPLVTTLLLKTLIEVPALLAAVISFQPKRLVNGEQELKQTLQPHSTTAAEAKEVPAEEKTSGT
jgi:hypothetical protein